MEILSFDTLPSTQHYLVDALKSGLISEPTVVIAAEQTDGVGSRDNSWHGGDGNFFASIALPLDRLPADLPMGSASIYFAFLMKNSLDSVNAKIWLKWPNDLYCGDEKIGGVITKKMMDYLVIGIGVNLKKNENGFSSLDADITPLILLNIFLDELTKDIKWKQIFSKYKVEFEQSRPYFTHENDKKVDMQNAILCSDGSLLVDGKKVYSLR